MTKSGDKKIILFDGLCHLCDSAITFVMKRDKRDVFGFAPLQTEAGARIADARGVSTADLDSVILVEGDGYHAKSSAVLRIGRSLGGVYSLLYPLILLPRWLRDAVYDFVARNRYRWFGQRESCRVPTPRERGRFLS